MTFKDCYNDCGIRVETRMTDGKWLPYEESGRKHDCPNSEYNKKKRGIASGNDHLEETQEKNDHGNDTQSLVYNTDSGVQKRKLLLPKIMTSRSPHDLEEEFKKFALENNVKVAPIAVILDTDGYIQYTFTVWYEAEV